MTHDHLAGIPTSPQRALVDLSAGAFGFWVAMHTIDVSMPIAALSAACKSTRSTGARHVAELRRCGYLSAEEGARTLIRVLDVRGRNAFVKI
jgi:hypothetical protein